MADRVDHIGIAVKSLDEAVATWQTLLGKPPDGFEVVEEQQVRVAFFRVGDTRIELLEPTSEDSSLAKSMDRRGPGLHHLCLGVKDADQEAARMEAAGLTLASPPGPGAGGCRVSFVHPKSTHGVLLEVSS